jgi:hypothetical protein
MTDYGKRRHARRNSDRVVRISVSDGSTDQIETARMVDVSEGGMCFIGSRYLTPGTPLRIEFGECRVVAEVRHCRLREYGSNGEFVTGVQVWEILEGAEAWIAMTQVG